MKIDKNINYHSEKSSTVSSVSYEIENMLFNERKFEVEREIDKLKLKKHFPKNLTFIDAHLDEANGLCASAFLDDKTGKVIIGLTVLITILHYYMRQKIG
ncbi:hypothetical protein RW115_00610 [Macrococcus capreoli]